MLCRVAAVKRLPIHHQSADYIFWPFGIIEFLVSHFENIVPLKLWLVLDISLMAVNRLNKTKSYFYLFDAVLASKGSMGWSGGAMVLGKLPIPGRPTILITVGQGPIALAVGAVGGGLDILLSSILSPLSPSLWETARYRLKYCLKGPLNPKQSTNQPKDLTIENLFIEKPQ